MALKERVVKPSLERHAGQVSNRLTFDEAFALVNGEQRRQCHTTGNQTPFVTIADRAKKGQHKGEPVLRFLSNQGAPRAIAYECCWGHRTNCNRTHIDCYTAALPSCANL